MHYAMNKFIHQPRRFLIYLPPFGRAAVILAMAMFFTARAQDQTNAVVASPVGQTNNPIPPEAVETNAAPVYATTLEDRTNLVEAATIQATGQTNAIRMLTLEECITRAIANNFDMRIQHINPSIQNWGVVFAQGGYDPTISGAGTLSESLTPHPRPEPASESDAILTDLSLGGKLASGASYSLFATDNRFTPTVRSNFVYTGTAGIQLTQPLLKNFGFDVNTATIRIARKNRNIAVQNFLLQTINSISAVNNAYYELIFAIEDYKSKREDLDLAQELLGQDRQRLRIGTMSPLDVVQAEAGVAERQQAIILAARTIKDDENALKLLISQNVREFQGQSLVPVESPVVQPADMDVDRSINVALRLRPDYIASIQTVERQNIQIKFTRNQLWPEIDIGGSYGWNDGGNSYGNWVGNLPAWSAGVSVTFPLGNRQARATYNSARLTADQLLLQLKQLEQQIVVAVDNAVGHVRTNYESVLATRAATRAAEESYKAERKKLETGTSTTFLVLQAESLLLDARSAQIRAEADYNESLVALAQAEGSTLQKHHIQLNEEF